MRTHLEVTLGYVGISALELWLDRVIKISGTASASRVFGDEEVRLK